MNDPQAHLRQFYDGEMSSRAARPLGRDRETLVKEFARLLVREQRCSLLEIGCGAARDALRLRRYRLPTTASRQPGR